MKISLVQQQPNHLEESQMAMNEMFPPDQFLGTNGFEILNEVNIIED